MITTERLILRPITMTDIDAMLATRTIPEVVAFTYEPIWTREYAEQRIARFVELQEQDDVRFTRWMVELRATGEVIGDVYLNKDDELAGTTEIGYVIHPDYAGHGYATEATRETLRIGFEVWGVHRIYARVDEDNIGSVRVCQHLGMRQEARLVENDRRGDVWSTELVFAMLDREWQHANKERLLIPEEAYYRSLPRRRIGAGVLITDTSGRILLLETTYKQAPEIPGGVCERGESPRAAVAREVQEEIGLTIEIGRLLVFDHHSEPDPKGDAIMLVYDAGEIPDSSLITIDGKEIAAYRFVEPAELDAWVTTRMANRLRTAIRARHEHRIIEIDADTVVG